jgi:hypothetical protein
MDDDEDQVHSFELAAKAFMVGAIYISGRFNRSARSTTFFNFFFLRTLIACKAKMS